MSTRSSLIPDFLKARSPQGLRRLMFLKNTKDGKQYNYFSIQFVGDGWVAWYYRDLADNFTGQVKEIFEGEPNGGG